MINKYVSHADDKHQAKQELDNVPYPFVMITQRMPPTKEHETEYDKKQRQMAYFHRSIVPEYAKEAGLTEDLAKAELQIKFARTAEILEDESGEFDVMWLEVDKLRIFEQGKQYYVLSLAGMDNATLAAFIEQCKYYLLAEYGIHVKEFINNNKNKKIKK